MEIRTIGIIGAGPLGCGIACASALAGYTAILEDVLPEIRENGMQAIEHTLRDALARGEISAEQKNQALANVFTAATVEDACRLADLLIDALPEEFELKLEIFTIFDKFAKPGTILASATTTVSIQDLAEMTYRTENCIGLRFTGPVTETTQVEIIRARDTTDEVVEACAEVARRMRKQILITQESPNSFPNRIAAEGGRA